MWAQKSNKTKTISSIIMPVCSCSSKDPSPPRNKPTNLHNCLLLLRRYPNNKGRYRSHIQTSLTRNIQSRFKVTPQQRQDSTSKCNQDQQGSLLCSSVLRNRSHHPNKSRFRIFQFNQINRSAPNNFKTRRLSLHNSEWASYHIKK